MEKLEKIIRLVLEDLHRSPKPSAYIRHQPTLQAKVLNLLNVCNRSIPEHSSFFQIMSRKVSTTYPSTFSLDETAVGIEHVLAILRIEKISATKIEEMKIFESAEEKMKQAGVSFRKEDYSSTFNNLNTALELILKDKCDIPTTITGINTSNVIDLLIKYKVEPYSHFGEARKRITEIANKVKHQAYVPHKSETILGIKAMEELIAKLRDREIKLTAEIKDKIYKGL
ncbi:MAG: hypothetical protein OEX77_09595 [Candidatus Bathyarchaeota archaeon]|nr:hypothetical protein [Candidatus Bathyarchaeota archaeon]